MVALFRILYGISGVTLAGTGVLVALVTGHDSLWPMLAGAAVGAALAVPVTWLIARRLAGDRG